MNRTLVILTQPGTIPDKEMLKQLNQHNSELIFALIWSNFSTCIEHGKAPWKYLAVCKKEFDENITIPYHLFPLNATLLTHLDVLKRLFHYSPGFEYIICDNQELVITANTLLDAKAYYAPFNQKPLIYPVYKKRSAFITRAQIFHNGHAEIIKQIMNSNEEVVVVLANAEKAFLPDNPATAGERLSMVKAFLEDLYPKKHWIIPVPYNKFIAENFMELKCFVPEFNGIFSTNPITNEMAKYAGYNVTTPVVKSNIRGEMIREHIINGQDLTDMVPHQTLNEFYQLEIGKRITELNK